MPGAMAFQGRTAVRMQRVAFQGHTAVRMQRVAFQGRTAVRMQRVAFQGRAAEARVLGGVVRCGLLRIVRVLDCFHRLSEINKRNNFNCSLQKYTKQWSLCVCERSEKMNHLHIY